MPTVPRYDSPQVSAASMPMTGLNGFSTQPMPDIAGRQAQQLGQAMQQTSSDIGKIAIDMQTEANQTRLDDSMNQLVKGRTDLATEALSLKGRNALERPDGKSLPDEYGEKLQTLAGTISDGLGNDAQRQAFRHQAMQLQQHFYGTLSSHMVDQQRVYRAETQKATLETAVDQAARLGPDEGAFMQSLGAIRDTVFKQVKENGGDDKIADAEYRKAADQTYYARYKAWQQEDAAAALGNFQAHRLEIGPLMRDRIGDELLKAAEPQLAVMVKPWLFSAGSAPVGNPTLANEPRGVRNNNPGNIVKGNDTWQGEVQGNDPRYASFATPEAGIRAMGKNLLTYQDKYGLNTVESIVARWAPATENNTASYAATVAKALGVKTDAQINLHDAATLSKLTGAMIQVENGKQPYSDAQISAGIGAALGASTLPSASAATDPASMGAVQSNWRDPNAKTGIPIIDNLAPDQRLRVFQLAHSQAHQDMAQLRESLHSRIQDSTAEYMARGTATNPPSEAEFIRAYGQVDGVKRYQELQGVASLGLELQRTKILPNTDLDRMLVETKPPMGEGFAARERNYEALQRAVQITKEQRQKDPVAYALQNSAFGIKPLTDFGNVQTLTQELGKRYDAMYRIAGDYGTKPAIMTDQEAEAFGRYVDSLQAPDKARVLGQVANVTSAAGVQSLSTQLRDKNNTLAVASMLASYQTTKGNSAALLYLQGRDAIEQKRAKIDQTAEIGVKAEIYKAIEGVYQTPQGRDAAAEAAYGIYAKLKEDGDDSVKRAVGIATGGVMDFNGGKIAKPYGWDDSRFRDAVRGTIPESIKATGGEFIVGSQKMSAADFAKTIPGARLQTYGQGSYLVMAGNDVVRTPNGSPFILKVAP